MNRHGWFGATMERLMEIEKYPDYANEYGCRKVSMGVVRVATFHLCRWMGENMPAPRIVPTEEGGLFLEWLEYYVDLFMEVKPDGAMSLSLYGRPEFLKKHGVQEVTAANIALDQIFARAANLIEVLRKEGPPKIERPSGQPQEKLKTD